MLTSLKIGNFKAFGLVQSVPIKPITLIFGANSAGKSSIIQSLLLFHELERNSQFTLHNSSLLRESWEITRPTFDIRGPKLAGNLLDLGGFNSFVHRGQGNTNVTLALEFDLNNSLIKAKLGDLELGDFADPRPDQFENGELAPFLEGHTSIGVSLEMGRTPPKPTYLQPQYDKRIKDVRFVRKRVSDALDRDSVTVQTCHISLDGEWIVRFERIKDGAMELASVNTQSKWVSDHLVNEVIDLRKPEDAAWLEVVAGLLPEYLRAKHFALSRDLRQKAAPLAKLCAILRKAASEACANLEYLGGIRAIPPRYLALADNQDPTSNAPGIDAWHWLLKSPDLLAQVNYWLSSSSRLNVPFKLHVHRLVDAELAQHAVQSVLQKHPRSGKGLAKGIEEALNQLKKAAPPELRLMDSSTGALVSHRDVGLGISQILPILVNALGLEQRTVCIEQPELHLHPALQAELGDLFIDSALGARKNIFLLETHSEHLILRILRRVRETTEGTLPKGLPPIRPEDVSVLFVEPGPKGAQVRPLPVTNDGDFAVPWPGGFFAERFKELP